MYITVRKQDKSIVNILKNIEEFDNGIMELQGDGSRFVILNGSGLELFGGKIYNEIPDLPEYVEPEKYCYTEADGFYPNPNYEEPNPYGISDDLLKQIKEDTITEVQEGAKNGKL